MVRISSFARRTEPAPRNNVDGSGSTAGSDQATGSDRATVSGRADGTGRIEPPVVTDRGDDQTTYRSSTAPGSRDADAESRAAQRAAVARAATGRPDDVPRRQTRPAGAQDATLEGRTVDPDREDAPTRTTGPVAGTAAATRTDLVTDRTAPPGPDRDRAVAPAPVGTAEPVVDRDGDGVDDRAERPAAVGPKPRASFLATLGLIIGVAAVLLVLTGALAGYGIALGALGAVLAVLGMRATRRRHVAGKTDALLGIAAGLGAVVLGVLAMTGQFDWPNTDGETVIRFREWLDSQFVDRF